MDLNELRMFVKFLLLLHKHSAMMTAQSSEYYKNVILVSHL